MAMTRHARHIMLKEIGGPGVQKLLAASVSIVGAGALGGPCALALAAAGVGHIELWDDDVVERSNLQRQFHFSEADIGRSKVETLAERLVAQNPEVRVTQKPTRFTEGALLNGQILIDATDNYPTRFALNRVAHSTHRRIVSGAVSRWQGQVAVFESGLSKKAPCYQCLVSEEPPLAEACDTVGVAGPVTGLIGMRMALETLKLTTDSGQALTNGVWIFDGLSGQDRVVGLRPDPECQVCGH